MTGLYWTRHTWAPHLPDRIQDLMYNTYQRLPTSANFMNDVESGFQSTNFNLADNITEGDSRGGLDPKTKQDIYRIMRSRGIGFDEARALYTQSTFKKAGIGADGLPNDPKLVTFGGR